METIRKSVDELDVVEAEEPPALQISKLCHKCGEWLALAFLVIVMAVQMWSAIRQLSVTSDEADHLHAGYRYLQCRDFGWNPEHPPLVKIVAALPLLAMRVNDPVPNACGLENNRGVDFLFGHEFLFANHGSMLTHARIAVSIFAILLLISTYLFARDLFGAPAALIAGALIAFEPNLLGHGSLVTTDVAAAFGFLSAIYALWRYLTKPGVMRLFALGTVVGLAILTKYSTLILIGILPILIVADALLSQNDKRTRTMLRNLGAFAMAMLIAVAVLWACYGFRYASRPNGAAAWTSERIGDAHGILATKVVPSLETYHLLPQAYLIGLQDVLVQSELGHPAYLLGDNYLGGRWYYFPVAAVIKLTVPLLAALLLSIALFRFWRARNRELLFLWVPVLIFLAVSATSGMNIGVRHVLPIVPLLVIFGATGVWNLPWGKKAVIAAVVVLISAHAFSSLRSFPNYISYGNELWGGPGNVYKYLADSNTDWGQGLKLVRSYVEQTRPSSCLFLHPYSIRSTDYGVPCGEVGEVQHPLHYSGTLVVSSSVVDGINGISSVWSGINTARIFRGLTPKAKLGGSEFLVYEGTFDLSSIIADQYVAMIGANVTNPAEVLQQAKIAGMLDPTNAFAHLRMCEAYGYLGDLAHEQAECNTAYELMKTNPYVTEDEKVGLVRTMVRNGIMAPPGAAN